MSQLWDSDRVAETIESYWRTSLHEQIHRATLADLVQHCLPAPHPTILEVGCGSGLIYERLAAAPDPVRYVGVDSSAGMLAIARRNRPRGPFVAADGYRLPFPDRCFDLTLCFEVLGHLPAVRPFVAELVRVTRETVLFTIWPSAGDAIVEGHEQIEGVTFLHRAYSDAYIRRVLAEEGPGTPCRIELHALSAECWAYAVHLTTRESTPGFRVVPFRGYQQRTADQLRLASAEKHDREREVSQAEQRREQAEQAAASLAEQAAATVARLAETGRQLADTQQLLSDTRAEAAAIRQQLERARRELVKVQSGLERASEETRVCEARAEAAEGRFQEASRALEQTFRRLSLWQYHARAASNEVAALRRMRMLRLLRLFRPGPDLSSQINPAFQDLLDDSLLFFGGLRGYRLQPSHDLRPSRPLIYVLELDRPNLSGLMLAPIVVPDDTGSLGIELVTSDGQSLASAHVPLSDIEPDCPTRFAFSPIAARGGPIVLRVDVHDTHLPVRLFEWRRGGLFGFGPVRTRPFCAFIFD